MAIPQYGVTSAFLTQLCHAFTQYHCPVQYLLGMEVQRDHRTAPQASTSRQLQALTPTAPLAE